MAINHLSAVRNLHRWALFGKKRNKADGLLREEKCKFSKERGWVDQFSAVKSIEKGY